MTTTVSEHAPTTAIRRRVSRGLLGCVLSMLLVAACSSDSSNAPMLDDPAVTGRELAVDFLDMLQRGDMAALEDFLAPAFQLQRPDGSGYDRAEYLADPAVVTSFEVSDEVLAAQQDDVLVVRWGARVNEQAGGTQLSDMYAPRLSTFVWTDGAWHLVAHANFNPPA